MEHGLGQLEWGYVSFWFLRWLDILKPARDFTCVCIGVKVSTRMFSERPIDAGSVQCGGQMAHGPKTVLAAWVGGRLDG